MSDSNKQGKAPAVAKAKATDDAVAKAKAEIQAEAIARAVAEAEIKAEAEAKALEIEQAKADAYANASWDEEPNKDMTRVFRVLKPPTSVVLMTLMLGKRHINGTNYDEATDRLIPNAAQQYVLQKGAIEYVKQVTALRSYAKKGMLKEIDPELINVPWIPEAQVKLAEAEALVRKLKGLV